MKRYLSIIAAGCVFLLTACTEKSGGGMSDKAKKNLESAKAVTKMFDDNDFSKLGDYIAVDAVDHSGQNGDVVGLDSIKAQFLMYADMMEMKNETVKEMADDDYVFQWNKQSWTMKKDGMGMKAGEKGTMDGIEALKFKDGKISEHWGFISFTDMMKMMGGQQPPALENKMDQPDSTNK